MGGEDNPHDMPQRAFALKRWMDIVGSFLVLLLLSPLFIAIALLVSTDGGPAFFAQRRIGKNGRIFFCYKFRSMWVHADRLLYQYLTENKEAAIEWKKYQKLKEDVRITRIGRWLRRVSADELPQFFNVLIGDMSIVGPRPITPEQQKEYGDDLAYYDLVRPGITGPWQVSGRNKLTFEQRVQMERDYVCNWSFKTDFIILLKTIPAVLRGDGEVY
jgi:undecaprenyl-phosphate galactose phosphotransferase